MAVTLNAKYLEPFVKQGELEAIFPQVQAAHHTIHERSGPGNDFLGWLDLPVDYDREEFARIQKAAQKIRREQERQLSCCTLSCTTIWYRMHQRFTLWETASALPTSTRF